jgi:methylated-DNA-[protein]-cysteine S-methyltransferase
MGLHTAYYTSPLGTIELKGNEEGLYSVLFINEEKETTEKPHSSLKECIYQLEEYFSGIRKEFGLKLNPQGSEFQQKVWNHLLGVPFGKTASYLDISKRLGDENATRAVGNANGKNPIAIIIPCHRVIGSNGKLTGYAGGLGRKEWLLNHEKSIVFGKQTELF